MLKAISPHAPTWDFGPDRQTQLHSRIKGMEQTSGATIVTLTMNPARDISTDAEVVRPADNIVVMRLATTPGSAA
jgi:hypothetical protein